VLERLIEQCPLNAADETQRKERMPGSTSPATVVRLGAELPHARFGQGTPIHPKGKAISLLREFKEGGATLN
jgi:hypothetical protein